jgi:hypothetical protein
MASRSSCRFGTRYAALQCPQLRLYQACWQNWLGNSTVTLLQQEQVKLLVFVAARRLYGIVQSFRAIVYSCTKYLQSYVSCSVFARACSGGHYYLTIHALSALPSGHTMIVTDLHWVSPFLVKRFCSYVRMQDALMSCEHTCLLVCPAGRSGVLQVYHSLILQGSSGSTAGV